MEIKNLSFGYGDNIIFKDFSCSFLDGKVNCVLGESGIGKTTLLNAIARGDDAVIKEGGEVSYVFQQPRLVPALTVYQNLELVLSSVIKDKKERKEKIKNALYTVELNDKADAFPKELSGGQMQRASLARAFIYPSNILLCDEPFKGLDIALKSRLVKIFLSLLESERKTVIFVTHDIEEALLLGDRITVLKGKPATAALSVDITDSGGRDLSSEKINEARKKILHYLL